MTIAQLNIHGFPSGSFFYQHIVEDAIDLLCEKKFSIGLKCSKVVLWDEDLGVEHFHPKEYVSIIEHEGLEISQPALDRSKSELHHQITARERKSIVHRRTFKQQVNGKRCDGHSKDPPCTGWIEMMAPVFSRAAWRCVWYMIQNDLIHAWDSICNLVIAHRQAASSASMSYFA
ncbi:uncharacterized protein LOC120174048 [Hibiscus syriacus]|uniref:uncharacterized protein LOC120174048 n=1 Tax=Hibiscus syriacus TaxID=106335 RepID=UPI0019233361|nr:uncharacterized protein LOC120174048 [Hibiscus syriacus]